MKKTTTLTDSTTKGVGTGNDPKRYIFSFEKNGEKKVLIIQREGNEEISLVIASDTNRARSNKNLPKDRLRLTLDKVISLFGFEFAKAYKTI